MVNKSTQEKPIIVCLCGSTRFGEAFRKAQFDETMADKIVLTIGCNMRSDDDLFGNMAAPLRDVIKQRLDTLHLRKIDISDEVLFLNVNGYIGQSTLGELVYAKARGKVIRWLEPIGAPGLRDPEHPCSEFIPINTAWGNTHSGHCETDGHYMCDECVNRQPKHQEDQSDKK